jgi:hypothetical protein
VNGKRSEVRLGSLASRHSQVTLPSLCLLARLLEPCWSMSKTNSKRLS